MKIIDLLKIIKHYGYKPQIKKLAEEQFEVIEALLEKDREHIKEEIADNIHMLGQFAEYYGISNDEILEIVKQKNERTLKIINREK